MTRTFMLMAMLPAAGLLVAACGSAERSETASAGFEAEVSGTVTGRVAGPGIIRYVPPREAGFGPVPGYYFVADGTGVRELGITFTIPAGTEPGTYELVSVSPMAVGTEFEVRVDRSDADRTESYERNASGTIRLESFPTDDGDLAGELIRGSFEFTTQDSSGREVTASGSFDFIAGDGSG